MVKYYANCFNCHVYSLRGLELPFHRFFNSQSLTAVSHITSEWQRKIQIEQFNSKVDSFLSDTSFGLLAGLFCNQTLAPEQLFPEFLLLGILLFGFLFPALHALLYFHLITSEMKCSKH